jgi:hypothetical protein
MGIFEVGKADFFNSLKPRKIGGPFTWDGKVLDFPDIQGSLAENSMAITESRAATSPPLLLGFKFQEFF